MAVETLQFEFLAEGRAAQPEVADIWAGAAVEHCERRLGITLGASGVILMQISPNKFVAAPETGASDETINQMRRK